VAKFKYSGTILSDQNCMPKEIKIRLNSENAYCKSLQNLLSSTLLSKNMRLKTQIYNVASCLDGYKTRSLMLREEIKFWVFENRILRKIFGPNREE
jgi:hypothetical protein